MLCYYVGITGLEKGQHPLTFHLFILGITFLQTAFNTITLGLTLIIFDPIRLVGSQIAVGVRDEILAFIACDFA